MMPPAFFSRAPKNSGPAASLPVSADSGQEAALAVPGQTDLGEDVSPPEDLTQPVAADAPLPAVSVPGQEKVHAAWELWRQELAILGGASALEDLSRLEESVISLAEAHPGGIAQLYSGHPTKLSNLVRNPQALKVTRVSARAVRAYGERLLGRYGVAPNYLSIGIAEWMETVEAPGSVPGLAANIENLADGDENVGLAPGQGAGGTPDTGRLEEETAGSSGDAGSETAAVGQSTVMRYRAPILLRPVRIQQDQDQDYVFTLEATVEVNPVLLDALRRRGIHVDVAALLGRCNLATGFTPSYALDQLSELGRQNLPAYETAEELLIGAFIHPAQALLADMDRLGPVLAQSPLIAALAGVEEAAQYLRQPLPEPVFQDRDPDTEQGVGTLDPVQLDVVDAVLAGVNLFVDAPPGADAAGTVAAVAASATMNGKSMLYVPGSRRVAGLVGQQLKAQGLGDILLDLTQDARWRAHLSAAIRRGPAVVAPEADPLTAQKRAELREVRGRLSSYIARLHTRREPWGVSAYNALQALADLTSTRPGPRTTVRFDEQILQAMAGAGQVKARALFQKSLESGVFDNTKHSPWHGAVISTQESAHLALHNARLMSQELLPQVAADMRAVALETGLFEAHTLAQWQEQLRMLEGIRGALDVFMPVIFEKSAADMVIATASREWRRERAIQMKGSLRRRLVRQAKDLLRPGRQVSDLHAELVRVQEQREIWRRYGEAGTWPRLPVGIEEIKATAVQAGVVLEQLQTVLATAHPDLEDLPVGQLHALMERLSHDEQGVAGLPAQIGLLRQISDLGLDELVADLRQRAVGPGLAVAEFELAWWASVLSSILASDPALAGYDGPVLHGLLAQLRSLDKWHSDSLAGQVLRVVAQRVRYLVDGAQDQVQALFTALAPERSGSVREVLAQYPLWQELCPLRMVPPMLVPQLYQVDDRVDLLILDRVEQIPLSELVPILARARQVVILGDSRLGYAGELEPLVVELPVITLPADRLEINEQVGAFLAEHGYASLVRPVPQQSRDLVQCTLELLDGRGMPAPNAQAVESTQVEVDRLVDLVVDHALTWPERSLAVVAFNHCHAQRLREAVIAAVANSPAIDEFFAPGRVEPFTIVEVQACAGLSRDDVILAVGFAKTPHGRVLHSFGPLSSPQGRAHLVSALAGARGRLHMVSCIGAADLDRERLCHAGEHLFVDLLGSLGADGDCALGGVCGGSLSAGAAGMGAGPVGGGFAGAGVGVGSAVAAGWAGSYAAGAGIATATIGTPRGGDEPDRLLLDLAERLYRLGLEVVPDWGCPNGVRIPMVVGHPDLPGEYLLAVLCDDADYVAEASLRRRDRLWVERLERAGWNVRAVSSTAVFLDPVAEAQAIYEQMLSLVELRLAEKRLAESRAGVDSVGATLGVSDVDVVGATLGLPAPGDGLPASGSPLPEPIHVTNGLSTTGGADTDELTMPNIAVDRGPRPPIAPGLPLAAYSDDQLDDLLDWICADSVPRSTEELMNQLHQELALTRRGAQVDAVLRHVVNRRFKP